MERLGKYEIISEIGRGAMGSVYKARDPLIGRFVALKTITTALSAQGNSLERFYQEARSAGALQHPNIVTIYELGQEDNIPFIAMEFIEGNSLDHIIEQTPAPPLPIKLGYIVHVCEALAYAHRHNVIHRDVKPANIMVTKEGAVKVVDFGIARLTDMSLTQPNMMLGSRAYMSPQLYKGERADARADIWAVGVTLYELLAKRRPFAGENEAELLFRIISDIPQPLQTCVPECSPELAAIVEKMLEKKAENRYQSMEDVTRDLEPIWKAAQQATVTSLLTDCEHFVAANDLQRAQEVLRKALQIDMGNAQAKSLMKKLTAELRRNQILPKVNEHLERGRGFLQTGKLREAHSEVEAALLLDSQHEIALKLHAELDEAMARALEVEQKLRLTKQRLAEGALTEAAAALGAVLEIEASNPKAQELLRQIEEEKGRREKRKKLSEILHCARTLWTALNYEECLRVLAEGLVEFPQEQELKKLQEMAQHDLEDLEKQRQLGEVRKLLGQQEFAQAKRIITVLAEKHMQDPAVKNLQNLVLDAEREQQRGKRLVEQMAGLRALVSAGEFADALARGNDLLREYPEEFELKEIVEYAQGEAASQQQRQSEKAWEKQIVSLMERESYKEAELAAQRAVQELPGVQLFQKLYEDVHQKKLLQEQSERAREEIRRRIEEIQEHLREERTGDAIGLAQRTLESLGPDAEVTRLLNVASAKSAEEQKKEQQERHLEEAKTMAAAGDCAGATQLLGQAMATKIFERSDPRVQKRLREIEQLSSSAVQPQLDEGSIEATRVLRVSAASSSSGTRPPVVGPASHDALFSDSALLGPGTTKPRTGPVSAGTNQVGSSPDNFQKQTPQSNTVAAKDSGRLGIAWESLAQAIAPLLRKRGVWLAVAGSAAAVLLAITLVLANRGPSRGEKELRANAIQLWSAHKLDESEQAWRELQSRHGSLRNEATEQIKDIENKRQLEMQLFQKGQSLLTSDPAGATQAFNDVIQMNLWLTDRARSELEGARTTVEKQDQHKLEQQHFEQGKAFFDSRSYDQARKEFLAARDLNVPNSELRPQIDAYLKRVAQNADAKKLFDLAMEDFKGEKWNSASNELQELVNRKGAMSLEAKKQLDNVSAVQKAQEAFRRLLQTGAYIAAKAQLDGMQQWPKTQASLRNELQTAEHQEANGLRTRATALLGGNDLAAIEALQSEVRRFAGRAEDAQLVKWAKDDLDPLLSSEAQNVRDRQGEKAAFDAAVTDFNKAREKTDLDRMQRDVLPRFQKLARGSGPTRADAQVYVDKAIPAAIEEMQKTIGKGRMLVPQISCSGGQAGAAGNRPSLGKNATCSQLDADSPLQWVGRPTIEIPASASQPGKLPYTLELVVYVDPSGKVTRVEKQQGDADKEFFKKAKDAAKNWRTSVPKAGGKAVSVTFPLAITFYQ